MIEGIMRPWYQKIIVDRLSLKLQAYVKPNHISLLAVFFGLCVPICLVFASPSLAVLSLLLSGLCDSLDGTIARATMQSSEFGAILDIFCDRIVEFSVTFGLFLVDPSRALLVIGMLGSMLLCITSFLVVGIFSQQPSAKSFYYSPGLMERAEAFILFIAMIWLPHWFIPLSLLFICSVLWTAFYRIFEFQQALINE